MSHNNGESDYDRSMRLGGGAAPSDVPQGDFNSSDRDGLTRQSADLRKQQEANGSIGSPGPTVFIDAEPGRAAIIIGLLVLALGFITSDLWYRQVKKFFGPPPLSFSHEHYAGLSAPARSLSNQGGINIYGKIDYLYERYFSTVPRDLALLSEEQWVAVAAAWITVSENPFLINSMVPDRKNFFCKAFPAYLASLKHAGDKIAATDLASLQSRDYCNTLSAAEPSIRGVASDHDAAQFGAPTAIVNSDWAPSFDCARASTSPELKICASKDLSASDVALARAYQAARDATSNAEMLKKAQVKWRKSVRDVCPDEECMLRAYEDRLNELQ